MLIPGSKWGHHGGAVYEVLMMANSRSTKAEYPVTVVYKNVHNGSIWSRPLSEWSRSFKELT